MTTTIYHNPNCSTSRSVLAMIRERGIEPVIIEYLKTPPSRTTLKELIAAMGISVRAVMRAKEALYREMDLDNAKWSDEQLIDVMVQNPVLIERPIVVTPRGTRLGRPKETVLEILSAT